MDKGGIRVLLTVESRGDIVHRQLRLLGKGIELPPLAVVLVHEHPAQEGVFVQAVAFVKLRLLQAFLQAHRIAGADLPNAHIAEPYPIGGLRLHDPVAAHGYAALPSQVAGGVLGALVAQLFQQPCKKPVELKAEASLALVHHLFIQIVNLQGQRYAPEDIQVLIGYGGAVGELKLHEELGVRHYIFRHFQANALKVFFYFLHLADISSRISITVSSC